MSLAKAPVPPPSVVWASAVVGAPAVFQQTPRAVTASPPSEVTLPPQEAAVEVTCVIAAVVTAGAAASVVKVSSSP